MTLGFVLLIFIDDFNDATTRFLFYLNLWPAINKWWSLPLTSSWNVNHVNVNHCHPCSLELLLFCCNFAESFPACWCHSALLLGADPVQKVTLASSDLNKSLDYWIGLLGLEVFSDDKNGPSALLGYAEKQAKLELKNLGENRICSSLFFLPGTCRVFADFYCPSFRRRRVFFYLLSTSLISGWFWSNGVTLSLDRDSSGALQGFRPHRLLVPGLPVGVDRGAGQGRQRRHSDAADKPRHARKGHRSSRHPRRSCKKLVIPPSHPVSSLAFQRELLSFSQDFIQTVHQLILL